MSPEPSSLTRHSSARRLPTRDDARSTIAVIRLDGAREGGPGVLFCGGFHSSMRGEKARSIEAGCARRGVACTRFDYRGHGESDGDVATLTLADWLDDALLVVDAASGTGELVVVGSSMGAWLAVHVARLRPTRVAALVLVAAAPDFLQWHLPGALDLAERARYDRGEVARLPTPEDPTGYPITRALVESGRALALLSTESAATVRCPVRMLHGSADDVAPWSRAVTLLERLGSEDATLELVRGGDHRLSTPADLARLERRIGEQLDASDTAPAPL